MQTTTAAVAVDIARVMDALRRAVRSLRAGNAEAEHELGVSAAQLFVLRQVAESPGISVAEVAHHTHTAQSSVSEVIARLVAEGYVAKAPSANDRRRAELSLTPRGSALADRAGHTVQERLIAGLRRMSADERRAFADLFDAWLRAAGLEEVPATMFFEPASQRLPAPADSSAPGARVPIRPAPPARPGAA